MYGHDHCQMHVDEGRGPVYVLSGAGFECCYPGQDWPRAVEPFRRRPESFRRRSVYIAWMITAK